MLDRDSCLKIIARDKTQKAEVEECLPGMEEEEALCYLHKSVYACRPTPYRNSYEIGYPAKFKSRLLDQEGWTIREIRRFGIFLRNQLLSDEAIVEELSGSEGTTGQQFKRRISIANVAHVSSARTAIGECLEQNEAWRDQILRALDEIEKRYPHSDVDISIFNPAAGLITIFLAMSPDTGVLYLPSYHLMVHDGNDTPCMYYGCLIEIGVGISFQNVIRKYYDGNLLLYSLRLPGVAVIHVTLRSWRTSDWHTAHFAVTQKEKRENTLLGETMRGDQIQPFNHLTPVFEYLSKRPEFVSDLALEVGSRWNGAMVVDDSVGEHKLSDLVDLKEGQKRNILWMGEIVRCDLCRHDFENDQYMVDAATGLGPWQICAPLL